MAPAGRAWYPYSYMIAVCSGHELFLGGRETVCVTQTQPQKKRITRVNDAKFLGFPSLGTRKVL